MSLAKASLKGPTGSPITFQFNPQTIAFTKQSNWSEQPTQAGKDGPVKQFKGAGPISLKLDLLLDAVEAGKSTVTDQVNRLASWTNPTKESLEKKTPTAPELVFSWGEFRIGSEKVFKCHLKSVSVSFTMFRPNGEPIRAKVGIELTSKQAVEWGQNPTSGGLRAHRRHTLRRGDRLATIAAVEYGSARYWPRLAAYNGIEDPLDLPVGRDILLPSPQEIGVE